MPCADYPISAKVEREIGVLEFDEVSNFTKGRSSRCLIIMKSSPFFERERYFYRKECFYYSFVISNG